MPTAIRFITRIQDADDYASAHTWAGAATFSSTVALDDDVTQANAKSIATDEIRARDGDGLKLYDDGSNGIFVEDGGQVGIGTTSPDKLLQINSGATPAKSQFLITTNEVGGLSVLVNSVDNCGISFDAHYNLGFKSTDAGSNFIIQKLSDLLKFRYDTGVAVGDGITWNTGMVMDSTGKLGISTESPDTKLQVVGDCKFGNDNTNYASFAADGLLTLTGTARVTVDMYVTASGVSSPGGHAATFIEHGLAGAWQFADQGVAGNQESISGTLKLPTQMDKTVVPVFKVGWSADGASPGNCEWQLEYVYRAQYEPTNAIAQETLTATATAPGTAHGLIITSFSGVDLPSATDQAMFFKLTRLSAGGNDTIADTVELHGLLFTHTRNTLGTAT